MSGLMPSRQDELEAKRDREFSAKHIANVAPLWRKFVMDLKRGTCWCEAGIDNPTVGGQHSKVCSDIQKAVAIIKRGES